MWAGFEGGATLEVAFGQSAANADSGAQTALNFAGKICLRLTVKVVGGLLRASLPHF